MVSLNPDRQGCGELVYKQGSERLHTASVHRWLFAMRLLDIRNSVMTFDGGRLAGLGVLATGGLFRRPPVGSFSRLLLFETELFALADENSSSTLPLDYSVPFVMGLLGMTV